MEMTSMENHDPNDPVTVYVREVSKVKPLTKLEETNLFRELGDSRDWNEERERIAGRLIESQLMLVVSIARTHSASGVDMLDLIEEGNIGLMNAVKSFAERPSGAFTDHAATCIHDAIKKAFGLLA
jgi:DNA-directed RNA polymerase sigma subunit (sigma70/sigma32)